MIMHIWNTAPHILIQRKTITNEFKWDTEYTVSLQSPHMFIERWHITHISHWGISVIVWGRRDQVPQGKILLIQVDSAPIWNENDPIPYWNVCRFRLGSLCAALQAQYSYTPGWLGFLCWSCISWRCDSIQSKKAPTSLICPRSCGRRSLKYCQSIFFHSMFWSALLTEECWDLSDEKKYNTTCTASV